MIQLANNGDETAPNWTNSKTIIKMRTHWRRIFLCIWASRRTKPHLSSFVIIACSTGKVPSSLTNWTAINGFMSQVIAFSYRINLLHSMWISWTNKFINRLRFYIGYLINEVFLRNIEMLSDRELVFYQMALVQQMPSIEIVFFIWAQQTNWSMTPKLVKIQDFEY